MKLPKTKTTLLWSTAISNLTAAGITLPTLLPLQSCPATPTCLAALANGGASSSRV